METIYEVAGRLGFPAEHYDGSGGFWWVRVDIPDTDVSMLVGWADPTLYYHGDDSYETFAEYVANQTDEFLNHPEWDHFIVNHGPATPGQVAGAGVYIGFDDDNGCDEPIGEFTAVLTSEGWDPILRSWCAKASRLGATIHERPDYQPLAFRD